MANRSTVLKWIKREKGIKVLSKTFRTGTESTQEMNFKKANARKPRPAQNKGRGFQGGWAAKKAN